MGLPKGRTNNPFGPPVKINFEIYRRISVPLDKSTYAKLKIQALETDRTVPDVIRDLLRLGITTPPKPTSSPTRVVKLSKLPSPQTSEKKPRNFKGPAPTFCDSLSPESHPFTLDDPLRATGAAVICRLEVPEWDPTSEEPNPTSEEPNPTSELRKLAAGNTPTRVIGLKLGRTASAIYKRAQLPH